MLGRPAAESVRIARASIRQASQLCRGADLDRLQRALDFLESAAAGMREAEAQVRSGPPADAAGICREAALLKRDVAGMIRAIDSCAALCRGISVRLGCAPLSYTPQGRAVPASPSVAACQMQG